MNKTYIKYITGVLILALLLAGGIWIYKTHQAGKHIIYSADPHLTDQEKQDRNQQINDLKGKLEAKDISSEDKYKFNMQIGLLHFALGEYKQAQDYYIIASKLVPDNAIPWGELYTVENSMQDFKAAERSVKRATDLNPNNPQYWRWLVELEQGPLHANAETIKSIFKDALDKTSNSPDVISVYAKFLEGQNDLVGAVAQWKKAIEINPAGEAVYQAEIVKIQEKLK